MKLSMHRLFWLLGAGMIALLALPGAWAQEVSHARVVRLSFTEGTVAVERPDTQNFAAAPVNTPIQEGFQLSTAENSFAEVEFENSSTARVGQDSLLAFPQLALDANGGKLNRLSLTQGYGTFDFIAGKGDQNQVVAGPASITVPAGESARFRADLDQDAVRLEVFKGRIEVSGVFGGQTLERNEVMVIRPGENPPVEVSQGITEDAWDQWVNEREQQAAAARSRPAPGIYSPNVNSLYGWNDLGNYGSWVYLSGYGYGWVPRVAVGWAPYSSGRWCWYPGFGFTWISYEPWGWVPFHYGGWIYQPGFGWAWIPGGMNAWSPALVTWYRGSGWIGWEPRGPHFGDRDRGRRNCPQGGCMIAVGTRAFQDGSPVLRHRMMGVRTESGIEIKRPEVKPTRAGMLTGTVLPARSVTRSGAASRAVPVTAGRAVTRPAVGAVTRPESAPAPHAPTRRFGPQTQRPTGVVFDSNEGRYVNNPNRPSAPEAHSAPAAAPRAEPRAASPRPVAAPQAPRAAEPARPAQAAPPARNQNFDRGQSAAPRSNMRRETSPRAEPAPRSAPARPAEARQPEPTRRAPEPPPQNRHFSGESRSSSPARGSSVARPSAPQPSAPRSEGRSEPRSAPPPSGGERGAQHRSENRPPR